VPRISGLRHKRLAAQAQQIVLAHQPQHPLVVDDDAVAPQLMGDVAVAAPPAVGQGHQRDGVARRRVVRTRRALLPEPVVAGRLTPVSRHSRWIV
jgi:hypothetical protein